MQTRDPTARFPARTSKALQGLSPRRSGSYGALQRKAAESAVHVYHYAADPLVGHQQVGSLADHRDRDLRFPAQSKNLTKLGLVLG